MTSENISRASEYIVEEIIKDLSSRCGLGDEWGNIDNDIKKEIIEEWRGIVKDVLKNY